MAEAIIVAVFLVLLIFLQIREQQRIILATKRSRIKQFLALTLAMMILIVFWPEILADQIRLIAFAILICAIGFLKDGLAKEHLVRFGILNGDYHQYIKIEIETVGEGQSFVTFYKRKNNQFSLFFDVSTDVLKNYFNQLGLKEKVVTDETLGSKKQAIDVS